MSAGFACDTSVLVPALVRWHVAHDQAVCRVRDDVVAIPGHVLAEAYSVLTRLPPPQRLAPRDAAALIGGLGHRTIALPSERWRTTLPRFAALGISGGATYDGLIAETSLFFELPLMSRDRRAQRTYEALGLEVRYLD